MQLFGLFTSGMRAWSGFILAVTRGCIESSELHDFVALMETQRRLNNFRTLADMTVFGILDVCTFQDGVLMSPLSSAQVRLIHELSPALPPLDSEVDRLSLQYFNSLKNQGYSAPLSLLSLLAQYHLHPQLIVGPPDRAVQAVLGLLRRSTPQPVPLFLDILLRLRAPVIHRNHNYLNRLSPGNLQADLCLSENGATPRLRFLLVLAWFDESEILLEIDREVAATGDQGILGRCGVITNTYFLPDV